MKKQSSVRNYTNSTEGHPYIRSRNENEKEIYISVNKCDFSLEGNENVQRKKPILGILRLDTNKPRRSSGGSVEFRAHPQQLGEVSTLKKCICLDGFLFS